MVIKALTRKLFRDLWLLKAQVLTIALVISGGAASIFSSLSVMDSLQTARDEYYLQGRFADVFTNLRRAPLATLSFFDDKKSITEYTARVTLLGRLWKEGVPRPLTTQILTYNNPETDLNRLFLRSGRWPQPNQNEVVISEAFFEGAGFRLGEMVNIIAEGRNLSYKIVGIAISAEFIYTLKPGSPLPDDKHFGILWGPYDRISKDFGFDRAFNSLVLRASLNSPLQQVVDDVDQGLANYGGRGAYGRESQLSHFFVTDELRQQKITAVLFPGIFLLVSGFLLNMILGRLVNSQREQIAILRALGYTSGQITRHYLFYVLVIVSLGCLMGVALGYWQGAGMIKLYHRYFRFLDLSFLWSWGSIALTLLTSLLFGGLGVLKIIWRLRRLQPAEALRPPTPAVFKGRGLDHVLRKFHLKPTLRMTLRSLLERPGRTLITILGLAFSSVILIMGIFWWDAVNYLISIQFNRVLKADTLVTFTNPISDAGVLELRQNKKVLRAEGYRQIPVKIYFRNQHVLTTLEAMEPHQELKTPLDKNFQIVAAPPEGLLLSRGWVDKLDLKVGDTVTVETLENVKKTFPLRVSKIVEDLIGSQAYIDRTLLQELLQEGRVYNSVLLKLDSYQVEDFLNELKLIPAVASVDKKTDVLVSFNESTAEIILIFATALLFFAALIAIGVVYNAGRISLAEKARILASLRILGFTHQEIFQILSGELLILTLLSLPLGSALGYLVSYLSIQVMETETFRLPMRLEPRSFLIAIAMVCASSAITALFLKKQTRKLDIIGTLKGQD